MPILRTKRPLTPIMSMSSELCDMKLGGRGIAQVLLCIFPSQKPLRDLLSKPCPQKPVPVIKLGWPIMPPVSSDRHFIRIRI